MAKNSFLVGLFLLLVVGTGTGVSSSSSSTVAAAARTPHSLGDSDHLLISTSSSGGSFLKQVGRGPSSSSPTSKPAFCHDLDCPRFSVEASSTKKYEVRKYEAGAVWAKTLVTGFSDYDSAVNVGFMKLFHYISGENKENEKVPMAAPVRVTITPGQGPTCSSNFTVAFFVPFAFEKNPATPLDDTITIERDEAFEVYVKSFGGRAKGDDILQQAGELVQALKDDGIHVDSQSSFASAGYDSPFRLLDRHNEVWVRRG